MILWWLCGGYVFPVGWNLKIWLFKSYLTLKVKVNCPLKTIGILTKVFWISGPNLVILAWMGGELWCGQDQNGVNLDFKVKFDLEGQCRSVHKTIGTLTKVFCIFGPNLVILTWTGPELSRGQASDWQTGRQTERQTHTQTQATTIPEGQNWPRVKNEQFQKYSSHRKLDRTLSLGTPLSSLNFQCYLSIPYSRYPKLSKKYS